MSTTRALKIAPQPYYNSNPFFDSACHRVLRCVEIFDLILQEVGSWNDSDRWRSSRSLALTCREFLDPAAAVLWKELPDLLPLYSVLVPEDVLKTFKRRWNFFPDAIYAVQSEKVPHPRTEAWSRFLLYAALVRKLRIFELQGFELKLFQILVGRNYGKTFLPYLREFAYGSCRREDTGLMELGLLASTSVHTLELCSNAFNYFHGERLDLWLTWTLSNIFPHLQHLTLGIEAATGASTNFFASFVALKQLRHLIVKKPILLAEPAHLQALVSALPQLESLNASIAWSVVPPPKSERTSAPSLRRLSIHGPWEDLARFPSLLQCPALEELELSMKPTTGPVSLVNCDTLCACVREVVEPHFAPRLRRLVIDAPVTHQIRRNRTPAVAVPERRSIADILGPLSALEHLEDVHFTMAFVVQASLFTPSLSDGDMRALAVALRHARRISLQIEYPADARPSPAPTLVSLVHFASLCPRLVSLSLPYVNTMASIPASARNKDESPPLCKTLRTLRLQDASPPSESETCRLAAFLCGLFPSLDIAAFALSKDLTMEAVVRECMCALRAEPGR